MKNEIEVKFLDVNIDDIRARLTDTGATLEHPMRLMRRVLIEEEHHAADRSFIRIRDEGNKTTLTFKRRTLAEEETTIDSTHEIETTVGDFDTAVKIFAEAGWNYITFQESKRETWLLDGAEVVIDEWPWLAPMIEIEADSEAIVRSVADKLGFNWNDGIFGSVDVVYHRDYPNMTCRGIIDIKEARFDNDVPKEFGAKRT